MAELSQQERLQPSLLDRLTDDNPNNRQESREQRVLSVNQLRESVLRDLAWLLNTTNLASVIDLSHLPHVLRSVINYGTPVLSGVTVSSVDSGTLQQQLRDMIRQFEPRILEDSIQVRVAVSRDEMSTKALSFEIEGDLWAQPVPEKLYLRTEIDLETGEVTVEELS